MLHRAFESLWLCRVNVIYDNLAKFQGAVIYISICSSAENKKSDSQYDCPILGELSELGSLGGQALIDDLLE